MSAAVSVEGVEDPALRAAMAELVLGLGATPVAEGASESAALVLVMVAAADELVTRLLWVHEWFPGALPVVLLPFSQPRIATRALALGAVACHALDQPSEHLSATLCALLGMPEPADVRGRARSV